MGHVWGSAVIAINFTKGAKEILKKLFYNDKDVKSVYWNFKTSNSEYISSHPFKTFAYILRLNWASKRGRYLDSVRLPGQHFQPKAKIIALDICESQHAGIQYADRKSVDELCAELSEYDVISFDIFDTAILRNVESPKDVFSIMAAEMGFNDFMSVRQAAEKAAREIKESYFNTREIIIDDIYDVLENRYRIDKKWMSREIDLELELCVANPYIKSVYDQLLNMGKTIIFMTDMYLPLSVIEHILKKNGYVRYGKIYLSNEYSLCKGYGSLQRLVKQDLGEIKVIHIGDNYEADVMKTKACGFFTKYYPAVREVSTPYKESNLDNICGSFYRAIVNNNLNNGLWSKSIHFEHGFKVGGILTCGYCDFINEIAKRNDCDLILFCARDCDVVYQIYNRHYREFNNEYIAVSRFALLNITTERYLYDYIQRSVINVANSYGASKNFGAVLAACGLGFLSPYMKNNEFISEYDFPNKRNINHFRNFIFEHQAIIVEHNENSVQAAINYFVPIIKGHKNILVADIGWSGSCITILKYFLEKYFPQNNLNICGTLMFTNENNPVNTSVLDGTISSYICSPIQNLDLLHNMNAKDKNERQRNHTILEYLFASPEKSLIRYEQTENGEVKLVRSEIEYDNSDEIRDMQQGMLLFAEIFNNAFGKYHKLFSIPPYVACAPFYKVMSFNKYNYSIFKNYIYDATASIYDKDSLTLFGDLFGNQYDKEITESGQPFNRKKIILLTHELTYTGAPHSLLRICKVVLSLGYQVAVWTIKYGPFEKEFRAIGLRVKQISPNKLKSKGIIKEIKSADLAIVNTILADEYATAIRKYIPVIWYIREATNIPFCCKDNPIRMDALKHSDSLYCVSDYAADYIRKYNKKVTVVHNCVEDMAELALPYHFDKKRRIRFVQLGTIEHRKGYDVLFDAFESLPKEYKDQAELFFAGGLRPGFTSFWTEILVRTEKNPHITYLGEIKKIKEKIETISQMDVFVVASRDEACSLVVLEGAMLSKPLIVTQNVGAKYIVNDSNGYIVEAGDVNSLREAFMSIIDNKEMLISMGAASRKMYEEFAGMNRHEKDIAKMLDENLVKDTAKFKLSTFCYRIFRENRFLRKIKKGRYKIRQYGLNSALRSMSVNHPVLKPFYMLDSLFYDRKMIRKYLSTKKDKPIIVSLTSHPARIPTIQLCIKTLLKQYLKPDKIILWLAEEQFPNKEKDLPKDLLRLTKRGLTIRWCDDLKPHKKYYYTMKENPEAIVIIVDDDVYYDKELVAKLYKSYCKFPHAISAMRVHRITFNKNGDISLYKNWIKEDHSSVGEPLFQLMATGVGGVLYPPHSLNEEVFNKDQIRALCLNTDDIWLKFMSLANDYPVVLAEDYCQYSLIKEAQASALYNVNVYSTGNDDAISNIVQKYNNFFNGVNLLYKLKSDFGGM